MDPDTSYNLYTKQTSCMKSKDVQKSQSRLTWQEKKQGREENILVAFGLSWARLLLAETINW